VTVFVYDAIVSLIIVKIVDIFIGLRVSEEVAREGRAGVTRVAVRTSDGRAVAEFTGYSRTLGGPVVNI